MCCHLLSGEQVSNLLKNKIKELNYNFEEIGPSIFLIKNFFTDEEAKPLWNIINTATQKDWEEDYYNSQRSLALRKYGRDDIENLIEEGVIEYTYDWADKAIAVPKNAVFSINERLIEIFKFDTELFYGGIDTIQRQYTGAPLIEHVDSHGDPDVLYAVIGYLNDDYTDGELFFSRLGIELKPPAKSFIIFPDGEQYLHGVKSPGPGPERYALPAFVRRINRD
jgi:hypothetical protein